MFIADETSGNTARENALSEIWELASKRGIELDCKGITSLQRLGFVKKALELEFSESTVKAVASSPSSDEALKELFWQLTDKADETVLIGALSKERSPEVMRELGDAAENWATLSGLSLDTALDENAPAELTKARLEATRLYGSGSTDNTARRKRRAKELEKVLGKLGALSPQDGNKAEMVLWGHVLRVRDANMAEYCANSSTPEAMRELILAKANGVSDDMIRKMERIGNAEQRREFRQNAEGIIEKGKGIIAFRKRRERAPIRTKSLSRGA